jgi:hypothetical protein
MGCQTGPDSRRHPGLPGREVTHGGGNPCLVWAGQVLPKTKPFPAEPNLTGAVGQYPWRAGGACLILGFVLKIGPLGNSVQSGETKKPPS